MDSVGFTWKTACVYRWALMGNKRMEEHRGDQMRTFVGWLWFFVFVLMFALFSVFPMENSLC